MKKIIGIFSILCFLGILGIGSMLDQEKPYETGQQNTESKIHVEPEVNVLEEEAAAEETTVYSPEEILERKYLALEEKYGFVIPRKNIDFKDLRENVNEHIYAWIYVPQTVIDYPVLQHPTDNAYYLNRNLDGSKGYPGCIYSENYNKQDFADPHTVLYGHDMKDDTMFGELHDYEDAAFFEKQPYFFIYTENDIFAYQIFRAYVFNDAHLLMSYDCSYEEGFAHYLEEVRNYKILTDNFDKELFETISTENKIVTLSTCVANQDTKRYLVQGVLLNR